MLYMRYISSDRWGEHPLSKLTHDIDEEITELENHYPGKKSSAPASVLPDF